MKKTFLLILVSSLFFMDMLPGRAHAQAQELQQLALDIQKLGQFKSILADMKQAYGIISTGYDKVKNVTEGNYSVHEAFLDGLLLVNPHIRNYARVADIITYQGKILSEYKNAFRSFKGSNLFRPEEISYISGVYAHLLEESLQNLDELTLVLTANNLRMSDDERLANIDRIYSEMKDKLSFLRSFNRKASDIMNRRGRQQLQQSSLKNLFNLKNDPLL